MNTSVCIDCREPFTSTASHLHYYSRFQVPIPKRCPDCRHRLQTSHINQLILFKRECAATKKSILTHYPPSCSYPVYTQAHWYSDTVDNTIYGREFDFSRSFFEQFADLSRVVPRPALFTDYLTDENSNYTNYAGRNKNCYLIFDSDENWDCYYGYSLNSCKNSVDIYRGDTLELCYQVIDSRKCYASSFLQDCDGCIDSLLLANCISCRNCICCSNLRQKEYHFFNQPISKSEYEKIRNSLSSYKSLIELQVKFTEFRKQFPQKAQKGFQNENASGNYLVNCKDAENCFDSRDLHGGIFCHQIFMSSKDCMDCHEVGEGELLYECIDVGYGAYNLRFCLNGLNQISYMTYCDSCFTGCSYLFGCVGLKRKKFCILNKQYSEEEYRELSERVINHMNKNGEWGDFFPASLSPFPYNITTAASWYPLSKEVATAKGYKWQEPDKRDYLPQTVSLADNISEIPDAIVKETLSCNSCKKNYKIVQQELQFYRTQGLPIPRLCWECRHKERMSQRNPARLWKSHCGSCKIEIEAAYKPNGGDTVFCNECYLESLE